MVANISLVANASAANAFAANAPICDAQADIPVAECDALVDLYYATDGPNGTNNSGWNLTDTTLQLGWCGV
ncbi:MAG: hypothetical protein GY761_15770 [Hyphomicrobiales bacterium]|nr:hypothetical protein [Hyphomicrobiales bacterium]